MPDADGFKKVICDFKRELGQHIVDFVIVCILSHGILLRIFRLYTEIIREVRDLVRILILRMLSVNRFADAKTSFSQSCEC